MNIQPHPFIRNAVVLVALCALSYRASSQISASNPPRFSSYKVKSTFKGKPAPVVLRGNPTARRFRTALREGTRKGPNFAGHYTVVEWGCGTECQQMAIVNAKTGHVYIPDFALSLGADYRRDSSLLIANPPEVWWEVYGPYKDEESPLHIPSIYYKWTGQKLVKIASFNPIKMPPHSKSQ